MRKKILTVLITILPVIFLGCGNPQEEAPADNPETAYLQEMESGSFYVRSISPETGYYECQKLAHPENTTFEAGSIPSQADNTRIIWFKEDFFQAIPTITSGSSLVYYQEGVIDENFSFERFEDFGYTIGLRGMSVSPSGRYDISTDPAQNCTYPGGDTDELLKLGPNETVKLDTLGERPIRDTGGYYDESDEDSNAESYLTRIGTIRSLEKGQAYSAEVYQGTIKHEYNFVADVRVLGSMDIDSTLDYEFISEKLISVKIPEYFESGYYLINGIGLFRYIKEEEPFQDGITNVNTPNIRPGTEQEDATTVTTDDVKKIVRPESREYSQNMSGENLQITIPGDGNYVFQAKATTPEDVEEETMPTMRISVAGPDGMENFMYEHPKGVFTRYITAEKDEEYYIRIYDKDARTVKVSCQLQESVEQGE